MEVKPKHWICNRAGCTFTTNDEAEWESHINNHDISPDTLDGTTFQARGNDRLQTVNVGQNQDFVDFEGESGTAYVCPKCGRLCSDKDSVELHTQTCGQSDVESIGQGETGVSRRTYRCQICHERFSWHGNLTRHLEEVHKIIKKRSSIAAGKAQWECDKCNYKAMYGSELERHKRLHKNIKPFACIFCEYNSSWKSDLKRHYEGHHKDKLGDEKLNDIMTRYKNNAGTHLETQTMDREKIASIVLNSSSNDSSKGNEMKSMTPHAVLSSKTLASRGPTSETSQDQMMDNFPMKNQDSDDSHSLMKCKECNFSCEYEWDLQKHYSHEHPKLDRDVKINKPPSSNDSSGYSLPLMSQFTNYRGSCSNSEESQSPVAIKEDVVRNNEISNPIQLFKSTSMTHGISGYPNTDGICNMANQINALPPYENNANPLPLSMRFGLPGAAAFASMMSMTMMGQFPGVPMYPAASRPPLISSSSHDGTSIVPPPPPPLTAAPRPSPHNSPSALDIGGNGSPGTCGDSTEEESLGSLSNRGRRRGPNKSANERNHRRFKCSQCAHRSNWKWDINKHIKVAHPGAKGARLIVLSEEEAVATLQQYLAESGGKKRSGREREGYYRPYKCSECGKRSNWEWDTNNHIKKSHNGVGQVVKLSYEESVRTIDEYMNSKKHPSEIVASKDPSFRSSPRKDALNLKRFKCNECGYRSNYRSDIKRHINRKHKNSGKVIILTEVEARDSLKSYVDNFPQRSNALFKKSIPPELLTFVPQKTSDGDTNLYDQEKGSEDIPKSYTAADLLDETKSKFFGLDVTSPGQSSRFCSRTKVWTCRICDIPFRSINKQEVFKHIAKVHPNDKPFVCEACGVGSDYRNSLIRHIRTKHRELLRQSAPSDLCCTNVDHSKEDDSPDMSVDNGTDNERVTSPENDSNDCSSSVIGDNKKLIIEMVQPELVMVDTDLQDAAIDYSMPKSDIRSATSVIDLSVKDSPHRKYSEEECSFSQTVSLPTELDIDNWNSVDKLSNRDWHCIKYKLNKVTSVSSVTNWQSKTKYSHATHQIYRCRHCSLFSFKRKTFLRHRDHLKTHAAVQRRSNILKALKSSHYFTPAFSVAEDHVVSSTNFNSDQKVYSCQICPFRHNDIEIYIQHVWHHSRYVPLSEFKVKCNLCCYRTRDHSEMDQHRQLHS